MDEFWVTAATVSGIGAVGAFVFWSLYKSWLRLPIFQTLTKKQLFILFVLFMVLTFLFGIAALWAYVYTNTYEHQNTEYAFWTRTKTGAGVEKLNRHVYPTKSDCEIAEKQFKPSRLRLIGFGCANDEPDVTLLQLECKNNKQDSCLMLEGLGIFISPTLKLPVDSSKAVVNKVHEDWRFWFNHDGKLLDEMFGSEEECVKLQAKWNPLTNGDIVFPCASISEKLLSRASEECSNGKEFGCDWKEMLERAIAYKP